VYLLPFKHADERQAVPLKMAGLRYFPCVMLYCNEPFSSGSFLHERGFAYRRRQLVDLGLKYITSTDVFLDFEEFCSLSRLCTCVRSFER
jgi:hypothetical protein